MILLFLCTTSIVFGSTDSEVVPFHYKNKVGEKFAFEMNGSVYELITIDMPGKLKRGEKNYESHYTSNIKGTYNVDSVNGVGNPTELTLFLTQFDGAKGKVKIPLSCTNIEIKAHLAQKVPLFVRSDKKELSNGENAFLSLFFHGMQNQTLNDFLGENRILKDSQTWVPSTDKIFEQIQKEKPQFNPKDYTASVRVNEKTVDSKNCWLIQYQLEPQTKNMENYLEVSLRHIIPKNRDNYFSRTQVKNTLITQSNNLPSGELLPPEATLIQRSEQTILTEVRQIK